MKKQYGLYNQEPVVRTYTGLWMNVFEPTEDMVCLEDIAHALSNLCRFGGHTTRFYSVAQHSIHCSRLVDDAHRMAALMHDASEAYLMDFPTPVKLELKEYYAIENRVMLVIAKKFGFQYPLPQIVKQADKKMLELEWDSLILMKGSFPVPAIQYNVKQWFLNEYEYAAGLKDEERDRRAA
jgi:hypothetical protein